MLIAYDLREVNSCLGA